MLPGGTTNNEQGKIELLSLWAVGRLSFATRRLLLLPNLWSLTGHSPAFFAQVWLGLLPSVTPLCFCFVLLKQQPFDLLCDMLLTMLIYDS